MQAASDETALTAQEAAAQKALLASLRKQAAAQRRCLRAAQWLWGTCAAGILLSLALLAADDTRSFPEYIWPVYLTQAVGVLCATLAGIARQRTALKIVRKADRQALGPLIEMFHYRDERDFAGRILPGLLTRLTASDAPLLLVRHREILNQFLSESAASLFFRNPDDMVKPMLKAILRAYEQVGDSAAIPIVERLANGGGGAKHNLEIRQAARECLPFLRQRGPNEIQRQYLLRASFSEDFAPQTLLRSAAFKPENSPEELLRPAKT